MEFQTSEPSMKPETVNVLGKVYEILFVEKVDEKDSCGDHYSGTLEIKIKQDLHADVIAETLLHELTHAVEEQLDLGLSEKQVHRFSVGMFQVLRDNPEVVKFLLEKAPRKKRRGK